MEKDHPHAYGDKKKDYNLVGVNNGSSPRVWGQVHVKRRSEDFNRIIPTRMGTRLPFLPVKIRSRDHPHAYGDKVSLILVRSLRIGSSPRVWGQVFIHIALSQADRIIPTRMGTRRLCLLPWSRTRDHPHAYGDKKQKMINQRKSRGSSPRVWGQVFVSVPSGK